MTNRRYPLWRPDHPGANVTPNYDGDLSSDSEVIHRDLLSISLEDLGGAASYGMPVPLIFDPTKSAQKADWPSQWHAGEYMRRSMEIVAVADPNGLNPNLAANRLRNWGFDEEPFVVSSTTNPIINNNKNTMPFTRLQTGMDELAASLVTGIVGRWRWDPMAAFYIFNQTTANARLWVAITDAGRDVNDRSNLVGVTSPTTEKIAGFRVDTTGGRTSNIYCVTNAGDSNPTEVDTGVSPGSTNPWIMWMTVTNTSIVSFHMRDVATGIPYYNIASLPYPGVANADMFECHLMLEDIGTGGASPQEIDFSRLKVSYDTGV